KDSARPSGTFGDSSMRRAKTLSILTGISLEVELVASSAVSGSGRQAPGHRVESQSAVWESARTVAAAPRTRPAEVKLSVVIPCFNEVNTITPLVRAVRAAPWENIEIIVVDDCSVDGTREKLKHELEPSGVVDKVLYHDVNQGKGA